MHAEPPNGAAAGRRSSSLSTAELDRLLAYVRSRARQAKRNGSLRPVVDELLVLILMDTGLKPGELSRLTLADVRLTNGREVVRVRGRHGHGTRDMEISQETATALKRFLQFYRAGTRPSQPLFLTERGTVLSYMSLYSKLHRIGNEAGLSRLTPGVLRRTFLLKLWDRGSDLRQVQVRAGHISHKTTARFINTYGREPLRSPAPRVPPTRGARGRRREIRTQRTEVRIGPKHNARSAGVHGAGHRSTTVTCEACDRSIPSAAGTRIDSGQVLCPNCLRDLRTA